MVREEDLKIERFNSGRGGQNQNHHPKNVRMTHLPTGTVVTMRGRYFHKNVAMAKKEMEHRLQAQDAARAAAKKKAARDAKIRDERIVRTYDFSRGIVKDNRTGRKAEIRKVMKGDLDAFIS